MPAKTKTTTATRRPRVAIGSRVSRIGGRDASTFESPDVQEQVTREFCDRHDFDIVLVITELDVSGGLAMDEREMATAIQMIEDGDLDGIVVPKVDRFSRSVVGGLVAIQKISAAGGFIVAVQDGIDTSTTTKGSLGQLQLQVLLMMAEWYRSRSQEHFDDLKRRKIADGIHITGTIPVGYTKPVKRLDRHDVAGPVITQVFQMRAGGASYGECLTFLDTALPEVDGDPVNWTHQRLRSIFANRVYLGEARQGKHVCPNAHPALVDQATFDTVQALAAVHPTTNPGPEARTLLGGLIRCATCGYTMERKKTGGKWFQYRCRGRSGNGMCQGRAVVAAPAVEDFVTEAVLDRLADYAMEAVDDTGDVDRLHAQLNAARAKRLPFEDPNYVAVIGVEAAARACAKVDAEIQQLQVELAAITPARHTRDSEAIVKDWYTLSIADRREVIGEMIDSVMASPVPRGTAVADRVRIYWVGDVDTPARPSRGRKKDGSEVQTLETAA